MWVQVIDGAVHRYPYSIEQFRLDNPRVSLPAEPTPAQLAEVGLHEVWQTASPPFVLGMLNEQTHVVFNPSTGHWEAAWTTRPCTSEEALAQVQAFQQAIVDSTQRRLDDFARTRNYDGILSACTYATSTVPKFAIEGAYCRDMRDATWARLYQIMGEVQAGQRPTPTGYAEIAALLPQLVWPN